MRPTPIRIALATALLAACASTQHPVPEDPRWLTYCGGAGGGEGAGAGAGKHALLVAAEQEYRAEQALPMLARLLSTRHGFHCTVLFAQRCGMVDPTEQAPPKDPDVYHDIPGLEHLDKADLLVLFSRFIKLPDEQLQHLNDYLDSGKPLIGMRTANHGFRGNWTYEVDGEQVRFGDDVLGGEFRGHYGGWHREGTRGIVVDEHEDHPVLRGVDDVFGTSDVYSMFPNAETPANITPLLLGQPLQSLDRDSPPNHRKKPLPVAWTKTWTGNGGNTARVFHVTMGSADDFRCADLRRLFVNATLWSLGLEDRITDDLSVEFVGDYAPLKSGFDYEQLGVKPEPPSHYR